MFAVLNRFVGIHGMVAAVAMCLFAPAAQAQEPIDVTQACIQAMRTITTNTSGDMRDIRGATIDAVRALDEADAPDFVIVGVGNDGRQWINTRARTGVERINNVTDACIETLVDIDAPTWMIARVIDTRTSSAQRINRQRDRATDAVMLAVRAAITD
ncbi:MAG: hypothetical protein AB8F26_00600 [Phycisphaerales bacterium]